MRGAGFAAVLLAALTLPLASAAQGTLLDRVVTFSTLTYDHPKGPLFTSRGRTVVVTDGAEFGLEREAIQNGLEVVPVDVNISANRIELDYFNSEPGSFVTAEFNGYVLQFEANCVLFQDARIDWQATTLPLAKDALSFEGGTVRINVSGLIFDRKSHFAVDLDVAACPLS